MLGCRGDRGAHGFDHAASLGSNLGSKVKHFFGALGLLGACSVLAFNVTASVPAYATYRDFSTESQAGQKIEGVPSTVYTGSDIPDGTYSIPAMTNSYMCIPYDPSTGDKNSAILTVSGGKMTVTFNLSGSYTAIYFGTGEEAASLTNEDGTDGSAYIIGDPATGYVPHLYSIGISSLNSKMTLATYASSSGKWWDRQIVFMSNSSITDAIANKNKKDDPVNPDPVDPGNNNNPVTPNQPNQGGTTVPGGNTQGGTGVGTGTGTGIGSGSASGFTLYQENESSGSVSGTSDSAATSNSGWTMHGVRLTFAQAQASSGGTQSDEVLETEDSSSVDMGPVAVGVTFAVLLAAGIVWRAMKFRRELRWKVN